MRVNDWPRFGLVVKESCKWPSRLRASSIFKFKVMRRFIINYRLVAAGSVTLLTHTGLLALVLVTVEIDF